MTLGQQQPNESGATAPDARHYPAVYQPPPSSLVLQGAPPPQQQQVAGYMVAGPPGGHPGVLQGQPVPLQNPGPNHVYPSSTPGPTAFPGSTLNQQLLQQHTYVQQPIQQVEASRITLIRALTKPVSRLIPHVSCCCEMHSHDVRFSPLNSCSSSPPDVHMLLLVRPPPPLLQPAAAALPAPHQPAAL